MAGNGSLAGKAGDFKLGSTEFPITNWELTPDIELHDSTNTKSQGHRQVTGGIDSANGTITFQYDPTDNAISSMKPGTEINNANLFFNDTKGLSNVELTVKSIGMAVPVNGMIEMTFTFESNGWDFSSDLDSL